MRKVPFSNKLKLVVVTLLLSLGSMLAWAITQTFPFHDNSKPAADKIQETADEKGTNDPAVLKQFADVAARLNGNQNEYLISGSVSSKAGSEKSAQVQRLSYLFSKKGNDFYYALGETETINSNGLYIYIDHTAHKVLLSPQKKTVNAAGMPNLSELLKNLDSEGYELTDHTIGNIRTISLLNNYHNSCKEYALSFDKETLVPNRIYMRLNKAGNEGKDAEQVVDMQIEELTSSSRLEKYIAKQVVISEGNKWRLAGSYAGYELVER